MCLTHDEECRWSTVCCIDGLLGVVALFLLRINIRLYGKNDEWCGVIVVFVVGGAAWSRLRPSRVGREIDVVFEDSSWL